MSEKVNPAPLRQVARLRHYRQRFTKGAAYIWRKRINFCGEETVVGALCPDTLLNNPKKLRLFWEAKTIELAVFDGNNPGAKHMRLDGTEKPSSQESAKPATADELVSGAQRKWNVKGLEETFTSKGAALTAAQELLDKQAAEAAMKKAAEAPLLGSNVQPDHVEVAPGVTVQLGDVVLYAFKASGLNVIEWNELDGDDREARLEQAIVDMGNEEKDPLEG